MTTKPIRVLLVDDDADFTAALGMVLSQQQPPFDVQTAGTLHQALDHLATDPPDVVLLDRGPASRRADPCRRALGVRDRPDRE
jgi:DNA-binding response OmpR family regulator